MSVQDDKATLVRDTDTTAKQATVASTLLKRVTQQLGSTRRERLSQPTPTYENVPRMMHSVTVSADANLIQIAKWGLVGVTAATQLAPIVRTEHRTESGLWVTTLKVSGHYKSLEKFLAFASQIRQGGAALHEMHLVNNNFDLLIDVFGTCEGCSDAH
jgi:hypothetical protein